MSVAKAVAPVTEIRLLELRNTYSWGGGPDKTILLSAERHTKSRVSVVVAYIRDAEATGFVIREKARQKGINFVEIEERGKFDPRVLIAIRDLVMRHDINLIHGHEYKSDLYAYLVRLWLWKRKIAVVSTAHAWVMLGMKGALYRMLDLFLMKRFNHLIAVSHATKDEMVSAGIPSSRISVIHNAIDTDTWIPIREKAAVRARYGLVGTFPVIGYVGRIDPEKDLETWLRAVAPIGRENPCARFVLVGTGRDSSTLEGLRRLACELRIGEQVCFLGYKEELQPVYASFDIFMMTSRREGLPNSVLEAMAMGLPVVTTDVAGTKELVSDGQTGFVRPQGDVSGLSEALAFLAGNSNLRIGMGQAGRDRVEREFSFANRIRSIERLYEQVLGLHTQSGPRPVESIQRV